MLNRMKDKLTIVFLPDADGSDGKFSSGADIVLFGSRAFGILNYKEELKGNGGVIAKMIAISKSVAATCFFAVKTDNYGQIKKSVAVFSHGKLLSVCDACLSSADEAPSFGVKTIKSAVGKMGVLVGRDLICPDLLKSLVICESELIIALYADIYDFSIQNLVPSLSYVYGTPIILAGANGIIAATASGKTEFFGKPQKSKFTLTVKRRIKSFSGKSFFRV